MWGRFKICCSCSKFTSPNSAEDEDLGICLAVVRVDIKVLSRGMVELERERESKRERERERERERYHYRQQTQRSNTDTLLSHLICNNTNERTSAFFYILHNDIHALLIAEHSQLAQLMANKYNCPFSFKLCGESCNHCPFQFKGADPTNYAAL